jgi:hypothetical protein
MRSALIICPLCALLAVASASGGCRLPAGTTARQERELEAGLVSLDSPIHLPVTESTLEMSDGITARLRVWEGRTPVFALVVASLERQVPFTGPRDEILEASMGERVRSGSLGAVTYDYREGVFTASADAMIEDVSVHVRAYMSRTRLAVVVSGGRPAAVSRTMDSLTLHADPAELFFAPANGAADDEMHVAWGLGFSCRMPGGVTVEETARGTLLYWADNTTYRVRALVFTTPQSLDEQRRIATSRGTVLEDSDDFDGGMRIIRALVTGTDGRWHAWLLSRHRSFEISGMGAAPDEGDRETISAFFSSCVY